VLEVRFQVFEVMLLCRAPFKVCGAPQDYEEREASFCKLCNELVQSCYYASQFLDIFLLFAEASFELLLLFYRVGFAAFQGDQTSEHFSSCHPEYAFLWIQLQPGFTHICECFCEVKDVCCFLFASNYNAIDVREYIYAHLFF
jgi:hypothetical protein